MPAKKSVTVTLDLDAPIVPGESAGGVRIDQRIDDVLATNTPTKTEQLSGMTSYTFKSIKLWATEGKISQIGLVTGYRGTLGTIGIGSKVKLLEKLGEVSVDVDENTIVRELHGVVFDVKKKAGVIAGIYVGPPEPHDEGLDYDE